MAKISFRPGVVPVALSVLAICVLCGSAFTRRAAAAPTGSKILMLNGASAGEVTSVKMPCVLGYNGTTRVSECTLQVTSASGACWVKFHSASEGQAALARVLDKSSGINTVACVGPSAQQPGQNIKYELDTAGGTLYSFVF